MYRMRPAALSDRGRIEEFAARRFAWMERAGHEPWPQTAELIASRAGDGVAPMWVITGVDDVALGCTIVLDTLGKAVFTDEERAEESLVLVSTLTDPASIGEGLGSRIAWWAVDRAGREGKAWVRRVTSEEGLVRYYKFQGFDVVRVREFQGRPVVGMQRRAQLLGPMDRLIAK